MLLFQIIYSIPWCIFFAALNARWIDKGKKILHGWNGAVHLTAAIIGSLIWGWEVFLIIVCNARIFFDTSLNAFRGLPLDYVSSSPKSIIDKWSLSLFGKNYVYEKIVCFVISVICNASYFSS